MGERGQEPVGDRRKVALWTGTGGYERMILLARDRAGFFDYFHRALTVGFLSSYLNFPVLQS